MTNSNRKIIVVRHGLSEANFDNALEEIKCNVNLHPNGFEQCEVTSRKIADMISTDHKVLIISSPLKRAQQTAKFIEKYMTKHNYHSITSYLPRERRHVFSDLLHEYEKTDETMDDVHKRCKIFKQELLHHFDRSNFDVIIVITHYWFIQALTNQIIKNSQYLVLNENDLDTLKS